MLHKDGSARKVLEAKGYTFPTCRKDSFMNKTDVKNHMQAVHRAEYKKFVDEGLGEKIDEK